MSAMDSVAIYKLFQETDSLLANYENRVKKGKSLDEGLDFCRYLFWSGLIKLLKESGSIAIIKIDAGKLEKRVSRLQEAIRHQYRHGKPEAEEITSYPT